MPQGAINQFHVFAAGSALLLLGMLAMMELGFRLGRRRRTLQGSEARAALEVDAVRGVGGFVRGPVRGHAAHIRFHHGQHMRRRVLGHDHVFGDLFANDSVFD